MPLFGRDYFYYFANVDRIAEARSGLRGSADIIGKRLLTLILDSLKLRNFQIFVKNAANNRCLCGYVYPINGNTRVQAFDVLHIFCVWLLHVCSFFEDGHCEGLNEWERSTVRLSRFYLIPIECAVEGSPKASLYMLWHLI